MIEPPRLRCVLVMRDGPSRRVGPSGVLVGRQKDCDLVTLDPSVSRRHALVRITAEGVECVPLGRAPIDINGKPSDKPVILADGDVLGIPGLELTARIEAAPPDKERRGGFVLERARGGSFGIVHTPFVIGGGDTDDLIVKNWPQRLLALHVAGGELFVELRTGKAEKNGEAIEEGVLEPFGPGDTLACYDESFVIAEDRTAATTAVAKGADLPTRVEIEMLPRGGRIVFAMVTGERAVYLSDRRFDLMNALLCPPEGYRAGEFVDDDTVRSVVWPRNHSVSRPEINMLISRCRRDLVDAGLAGPRLIERAPGGGGTRVTLAPNAEIVVKS
ncbi:MAG: FHA domain-containing protein [Kofleriaceae bacterium]